MYNNAGGKVKGLATTITVLTMIVAIIFGLIGMSQSFLAGLFIILFGCLGAWLSGLMLAAFGELVENTYYIRKHLTEGVAPVSAPPARPAYADTPVSRAEINTVMQRDGVPYGDAVVQAKKEKTADTTFYAPANNSFVNPNPNPASAPATCPNCGSPRKGNSAFCGFCGTRL